MSIAKFFDRKKRELSSNLSVDKAAAKKQHEKSLNDSMRLDKDDVFAQGLKSPECVKLLFKCLQNLETEHMNQKIKPKDIDRSHRLGNPKKSIKVKPQPIIVKYVRYNTRNIIYRNKNVLKGKQISVTESLLQRGSRC